MAKCKARGCTTTPRDARRKYCSKHRRRVSWGQKNLSGQPRRNPAKHAPWIKHPGTLGTGFLTSMTDAQRFKAIDRAVKKYGYRSALGKIMVLQRSRALKAKYGAKLRRAHAYIVNKYGGSW